MRHVKLFFRVLEVLMGMFCCYRHMVAATYQLEPMPHVFIYCGIFFGFTFIALASIVMLIAGAESMINTELLVNAVGAISHFVASATTMYHAEEDPHLAFMSNKQELMHEYFRYCKMQSIGALVTGSMFLLHTMINIEVRLSGPSVHSVHSYRDFKDYVSQSQFSAMDEVSYGDLSYKQRDNLTKEPIRVYFLSKPVEDFLTRFEWFRQFSGRSIMSRSQSKAHTVTKYDNASSIEVVQSKEDYSRQSAGNADIEMIEELSQDV